jgi:hypothetical protein
MLNLISAVPVIANDFNDQLRDQKCSRGPNP